MPDGSAQFRRPSVSEVRLLRLLVARASDLRLAPDWQESLRVRTMADGEMGSLALTCGQALQASRDIGRRAAEVQFEDADGVTVVASLNVDQEGQLLELDMWKLDFSPLVRIPDEFPDEPGAG